MTKKLHDLSTEHTALRNRVQQQFNEMRDLRSKWSALEFAHRSLVENMQLLEHKLAQAIHKDLLRHSCTEASDPNCVNMQAVADQFYLACHAAYRERFRGIQNSFNLGHLVGMRRLLKNVCYTQGLMTHFMELNDDYKRIYLNEVPPQLWPQYNDNNLIHNPLFAHFRTFNFPPQVQVLTQLFLDRFALDHPTWPGGELLTLDLASENGADQLNELAQSFITEANDLIMGTDQKSAAT